MGASQAIADETAREDEGGVVVAKNDAASRQQRIKAAAEAIRVARPIFDVTRALRDSYNEWMQAIAPLVDRDHGGQRDLPVSPLERLRVVEPVIAATRRYIEAVEGVRPLLPAPCESCARYPTCNRFADQVADQIDESIRYATAFVLDEERSPQGAAQPVSWAMQLILSARASDRGVKERSMKDVAWSAGFSFVSWTQTVDVKRAIELQEMADHDVAAARRLASASDERRIEDRKTDSNSVGINRARALDAEAADLSRQPEHVQMSSAAAMQYLAKLGDPIAIQRVERAKRRGTKGKAERRIPKSPR